MTTIQEISNLCNKISISYGIKEPDGEFIKHLYYTLCKYHSRIDYEQLELAFEANSMNLLNEYLPKSGFSTDNKVKFTIPDMMKIIKAYIRFKKLDSHEKELGQEPENSVKDASIQKWCDNLEGIFRKYSNEHERSIIGIPMFTCEVLAEIGVLDKTKIDYSEQKINIGFKKMIKNKKTHNTDLIFSSFDTILENGDELRHYLDKFRYKYAENELPIF